MECACFSVDNDDNVHKSNANSARWEVYKAVNHALDVTSSMAWNAQYTLNCLCSMERALSK